MIKVIAAVSKVVGRCMDGEYAKLRCATALVSVSLVSEHVLRDAAYPTFFFF